MQVLTIQEAAIFLKYKHPNSLRRLIRKYPDSIPHKRVGRGPKARYVFVKERLEAWINEDRRIDPRRVK